MTNKYRTFWIEYKKFIDEWIYEAFDTKEKLNKNIVPIEVIERAALDEAVFLIQGLKRHIDIANKLGMGNGELSNKIDDFLKGLGEG